MPTDVYWNVICAKMKIVTFTKLHDFKDIFFSESIFEEKMQIRSFESDLYENRPSIFHGHCVGSHVFTWKIFIDQLLGVCDAIAGNKIINKISKVSPIIQLVF